MTKTLLLAAVAATTVALPGVAQAQRVPAAVIAVVDSNRAARECNACRTAWSNLQSQAQALQTRQQTLDTQLRPEAQSLEAAVRALGNKQPDAALQQRATAFEQRRQQAAQEIGRAQQNLQSIQANIVQQINARLGPAVNQVMAARGANLVLDTDARLASAPALDVTNDVIAALNTSLPSITVAPLPQQQQQAPQGR